MSIKLKNTLTNNKDVFKPINSNEVLIYSCGPTVYDKLHVGNWAAYIYWDILVRILLRDGLSIKRVINITDVGHLTSDGDEGEDKLEKGAKREGKSAWEIANYYTEDFMKGVKNLNIVEPEYFAKATDYIDEQLELVRKLKNKGFTYQISDGIYFDTSKFPKYAEFAHLDLEALKAGARVHYNPEKKNPGDFALWKFTRFGQKRDMQWETPTDLLDDHLPSTNYQLPITGFPGWHLECSAIAMKLLGETIDIHTGGIDHIPVHHTNEIAQSEAATGKKFCNYWLHNNHLKSNGTKISKSLGNGYTLDNLENQGFDYQDFRMFVLQGHYENEGNFTLEGLTAAKNRLKNWKNIASLRHQIYDTLKSEEEIQSDDKTVSLYATSQAVVEAIEDNLNTPSALMIIDEAFSRMSNISLDRINRDALVQLIIVIDEVTGLKLLETTPDVSDDIKRLILERKQARTNKDFKKSDDLRKKLEKHGILIRDTLNDTIWEYK